jgi:hypothetical protein
MADDTVNLMSKLPVPFTPNANYLDRGVEHVCYEYANLMTAAYWDIHGSAPWRTQCDDAFLFGYRKLGDFLLNKRRSTIKLKGQVHELPDILASDYLPPGFVPLWNLPTWTVEWRDTMNRQLAHLSFDREKEWIHYKWVPTLEREMRVAWAKFLQAVVTRYKQAFTTAIDKKRADLKPVQL